MEIGAEIDKLRHKHQLSMAEISKGVLSESNYSRFSRGKTMISIESFIDLLKNLEADFYEISNLNHNPRVVDKYKAKYLELLSDKDYDGLRQLGQTVAFLSKVHFDTYHNIALSIEVQLAKYENRPINQDIHYLVKDLLIRVEKWSHKEAFIFEVFIESFEVEFTLLMIKNITKNNQNYMVAEKNSHVISLLFTSVMFFLKRKNIQVAESVFELMQPYMIVVGLTTHKFYFTLAKLLLKVVEQPTEENLERIIRLYNLCISLGNKSHSYKVSSHYESIREIYNLPNILKNE